ARALASNSHAHTRNFARFRDAIVRRQRATYLIGSAQETPRNHDGGSYTDWRHTPPDPPRVGAHHSLGQRGGDADHDWLRLADLQCLAAVRGRISAQHPA